QDVADRPVMLRLALRVDPVVRPRLALLGEVAAEVLRAHVMDDAETVDAGVLPLDADAQRVGPPSRVVDLASDRVDEGGSRLERVLVALHALAHEVDDLDGRALEADGSLFPALGGGVAPRVEGD